MPLRAQWVSWHVDRHHPARLSVGAAGGAYTRRIPPRGGDVDGPITLRRRGWNNFTFGTGVWTIAMFQLQGLAREEEWELVEEVDNHRVTFVKDGLHLSCYKVGSTADEDIFTSFPNNQNAAKRLVANNRQFDLFGDRYQAGSPVNLVLAHLGTPERGLEARVYWRVQFAPFAACLKLNRQGLRSVSC